MGKQYNYRQMLFLIREELAKAYAEPNISEEEISGIKRCLVAIEKRGIQMTSSQRITDEDLSPMNVLLGKMSVVLKKKPIPQNYCHQLINDYITREEIGKEIYDYGVQSFGEIEETGRESISDHFGVKISNAIHNQLGLLYMDQLCLVPSFVLESLANVGVNTIKKIESERRSHAKKYNLELEK